MTLGIHFSVKLMKEKTKQWMGCLQIKKDDILWQWHANFFKKPKSNVICIHTTFKCIYQYLLPVLKFSVSFLFLLNSFCPCWYFCYLMQLKATEPWCDWAAAFSMLELVFYNATCQGQTWWIVSFYYCHLKKTALWRTREKERMMLWEGRGVRKWQRAWSTECQINCPSLILGHATVSLLRSSNLAFHELQWGRGSPILL